MSRAGAGERAITADEIRDVVFALPHQYRPARIDGDFVEHVRIAYRWATTARGRWGTLRTATVYDCRHWAAYEMDAPRMTDAQFVAGAALAGWLPTERVMRRQTWGFVRMKETK